MWGAGTHVPPSYHHLPALPSTLCPLPSALCPSLPSHLLLLLGTWSSHSLSTVNRLYQEWSDNPANSARPSWPPAPPVLVELLALALAPAAAAAMAVVVRAVARPAIAAPKPRRRPEGRTAVVVRARAPWSGAAAAARRVSTRIVLLVWTRAGGVVWRGVRCWRGAKSICQIACH